jgi:hypothetical protein
MAALPIEPAGLCGLVVLRRRFTKASGSPVHGFSTKHLLYDLQGDLLEMRLGFLLGAAGLDHGGTVPAPACYGSPLLDVDLSLILLATDSNSGTCAGCRVSTRQVLLMYRYDTCRARYDLLRFVTLV